MLFPISDALAAGEAASAGGMESFLVQVVPLIVIFVVFWFFLIRPQQKRQKEHAKMCDALAKGDEVMTMGGISGRIESVDEQSMALQVASVDGKPVVIRMQRSAARRGKCTYRKIQNLRALQVLFPRQPYKRGKDKS